jgi:hypothetical protein
LGKPYGIEVLLGTSWGMHLGTLWEHDENTLRTRGKKTLKPNLDEGTFEELG